jgi:hypothetical protein
MESSGNGEQGGVDPQFQMFDESPLEEEIRSIPFDGENWAVVLQTRECADRLFRGRFLFRSKGRELRTTDLFIEATYEEILERARNFEEHLLRDLVRSLA